jgi:hypothetical protein
MTDQEHKDIKRIERDRRKREGFLLGALLSLTGRAFIQAKRAVRVGANAVGAAVSAVMGRHAPAAPSHVHWRGLADVSTPILFEAYTAGIRRAGLLAGVAISEPPVIATPPGVAEIAVELEQKTAEAVARVVSEAIAKGEARDANAAQVVRLVNEAATSAGMVDESPSALEAGVERAIVTAYGAGLFDAAEHKDLIGRVTGFKYVSVLDEVTTPICRAYNGVTLPTGHPWWRTHFPANHWRCRAVIRPRFDKFTPTEDPPYFPEPLAGFGVAPIAAFGSLVGR